MKFLVPFFVLSTILFACQSNEYKAELNEIESLNKTIDTAEQKILALDTAEIYRRLNKQIHDLNFIQTNIDSMSRTNAFILNEYAAYKKAYSKWGEKIPIFFKEIELRRNQLTDLKKDIQNDIHIKDSILSYIDKEDYYISALRQIVHQMEFGLHSIDSVYLKSQLRVDTIISNIKSDSLR